MLLSRLLLLFALAAVFVAAQAPANTPCTAAVSSCCTTRIEYVDIDGVTYSHQVCRDRVANGCTTGCRCEGVCDDLSAYCTCVDPTPSPTATASESPSGSATATPSASLVPSASVTVSRSHGASPSVSPTQTTSNTPSATNSVSPSRQPSTQPSVSSSASPSNAAKTNSQNDSTATDIASVSLAVLCCLLALVCGFIGALIVARTCRSRSRRYKKMEDETSPDNDQNDDGIALRRQTDTEAAAAGGDATKDD